MTFQTIKKNAQNIQAFFSFQFLSDMENVFFADIAIFNSV